MFICCAGRFYWKLDWRKRRQRNRCKRGKRNSMGTNLYVGNLPFSVGDDQLAQLFQEAGTVTAARVITDKFSGQSRGFGFVEMATDAEAQRAISMLNGRTLEDRALTVNEARPRTEGGSRGGRDTRRGGRNYDRGGYSRY
jgi:RNA recognition motif-containing protein